MPSARLGRRRAAAVVPRAGFIVAVSSTNRPLQTIMGQNRSLQQSSSSRSPAIEPSLVPQAKETSQQSIPCNSSEGYVTIPDHIDTSSLSATIRALMFLIGGGTSGPTPPQAAQKDRPLARALRRRMMDQLREELAQPGTRLTDIPNEIVEWTRSENRLHSEEMKLKSKVSLLAYKTLLLEVKIEHWKRRVAA